MATQPGTDFAFGPFQLSVSAGELRNGGIRLKLPPQPFELLVVLLSHPGEVVTREQLRERIWGDGTFVDFERGLNSAVAKLRRALNDSAERPRYIETVPGRGYRFVGTLASAPATTSDAPAPSPAQSGRSQRTRLAWAVALSVALVMMFVLWRGLRPGTRPPAAYSITRVTADAGISAKPSLSRDGKLIAYSSDREIPGSLDLYVQLVVGGQPVRLTFDGNGNTEPDFSPDGSMIAFRSNRDGGAIYEIPTFGGQPRLIARGGYRPKYSPSGKEIAYWIGSQNIAQAVPGNGEVWVVPVAGGQPRRVGTGFTSVRQPMWSPDGKHLVVIGYRSKTAYDATSLDWWLIPTGAANDVTRMGIYDALFRSGLRTRDLAETVLLTIPVPQVPTPACWVESDAQILFSLDIGNVHNLWAAGVSKSGTLTGKFTRLTAGAGNEVDPSCSNSGSVAFTSLDERRQIWSQRIEADSGVAIGPPERMTRGPANREYPSLSTDGQLLAFVSEESARMKIRLRNLREAREFDIAPSRYVQRYPELSPSGSRVAFSTYEGDARNLYVSAVPGTPELVCHGCLRATDWSRDEKSLLVYGGTPFRISLLNLDSRTQTVLAQHESSALMYARFSPDDRWIAFTERVGTDKGWITVAPIEKATSIPKAAWIRVSDEGPEDRAYWSHRGTVLYFSSRRDGHTCLWGQKLDGASRRPVGEPFVVQHLHDRTVFAMRGWSLAGDRIVMTLVEDAGNIWMMARSRPLSSDSMLMNGGSVRASNAEP